MAGGQIDAGVIKQGGARYPEWINNISLVNATTTNTNDSIRIRASDGNAFSVFNYGWVTLPSATLGQLATFSITSNVTINIQGAHWGHGTKGDLTNYILYVYAINDNGTLRWGVADKPYRKIVLDADDTATSTSATSYEKVLVNSALTGDSYCRVVGWFKANFDDTGGAAEDLWAIQTGQGAIFTTPLELEASKLRPGYIENIGIGAATTTNANDSIRIFGADGQSLSINNIGWVVLPSGTPGRLEAFPVTANVTILLTGAHWGLGTTGDATDYLLSVYAMNDGLLKWGVASVPNQTMILNADDSATTTDINLVDEVLVNTLLVDDAQCLEVGFFRASFDDTGGAAEDLWAVQTGDEDIRLGPRPAILQKYTPTGTWTPANNATLTGFWMRTGSHITLHISVAMSGSMTGACTFNMPSGFVIDTSRLTTASGSTNLAYLGNAQATDSGGTLFWGVIGFIDTTSIRPQAEAASAPWSATVPFSFNAADGMSLVASMPVVGWD